MKKYKLALILISVGFLLSDLIYLVLTKWVWGTPRPPI